MLVPRRWRVWGCPPTPQGCRLVSVTWLSDNSATATTAPTATRHTPHMDVCHQTSWQTASYPPQVTWKCVTLQTVILRRVLYVIYQTVTPHKVRCGAAMSAMSFMTSPLLIVPPGIITMTFASVAPPQHLPPSPRPHSEASRAETLNPIMQIYPLWHLAKGKVLWWWMIQSLDKSRSLYHGAIRQRNVWQMAVVVRTVCHQGNLSVRIRPAVFDPTPHKTPQVTHQKVGQLRVASFTSIP